MMKKECIVHYDTPSIETLETHHEAQRKDVEAWREVSCATAFPPEESEVDTQAFFQ